MSPPLVTLPDAETPPYHPTNRVQQAVDTVEAAGSKASSENDELAPANLFDRLDQIQNTMNLHFGQLIQVNANITTLNANITTLGAKVAQNSADIVQINANITTLNAKVAQNSADIVQINANITTLGANFLRNSAYVIQLNKNVTSLDAKVVQNSADIVQIKQNTTLIVQALKTLNKNIIRNDANTRARIINSHAKSPTYTLRPLLNTALVSYQGFPTTLAELDELDYESIGHVLQQLDSAIDGNTDTKRNHLRDHIGVLPF